MRFEHLEHVLRAAGEIIGESQFLIIGSQSLHGKYPDLADKFLLSFEVDLIAKNKPQMTEVLITIGELSDFHDTFGYYADPVDENTSKLPRGWKGRLVNLKTTGASNGVSGLCLDPHDLAISKFFARREKDVTFTRKMIQYGILDRSKLESLVEKTKLTFYERKRMLQLISSDFLWVTNNPIDVSNDAPLPPPPAVI
ncbi:MAG: hypothetical protein Q8O64_05875 [Sideroxyarcus sp.]|nr:hypothetical protein [Sideroxyarcus sp.]